MGHRSQFQQLPLAVPRWRRQTRRRIPKLQSGQCTYTQSMFAPLQTSKFPQLRSGNWEGGAADTNFLELTSLYFSLL